MAAENGDASANGVSTAFIGEHANVDDFMQHCLKQILTATKLSNGLPGGEFDYYSTFPEFRKAMTTQGNQIRKMIHDQAGFQQIKLRATSSEAGDLIDMLTDASDTILERINMNLDEAAGLKRTADPLLLEVSQSNVSRVSGSWNNFDRSKKSIQSNKGEVKLLAAKNVVRPQVKFSKLVDNTTSPFMPRLKDKPNSRKPLSVLVEYADGGEEFFSHPYLFEIQHFNPTQDQLAPRPISLPKSVDSVDLTYVDTKDKLHNLVAELKTHKIIGVDVEAHTYRSYHGIVCLIQISTIDKDFLIDPFDMWEEMTLLNEVTTDPNIVKVLHGCDSDVVWLQRDFSVYLVNVFDTHQAGKLLGLPRLSLAWLLEHYCKIYADKQYQLADWRIRPLPKEMTYYARQDTRYLIFLYEKLKVVLLEKANGQNNLLKSVFQQSNILCTTRFNKIVNTSESHLKLLQKSKAVLNNKQMFALQEIFSWRDGVARQEDESWNYVLPNHMLLKICTELPREMQGILACCNPVPPLVKQNLHTLHMIILQARAKTLQAVDTDLDTSTQNNTAVDDLLQNTEYDENPLHCPMDLSTAEKGRSDLATLVHSETDAITSFVPALPTISSKVKKQPDLALCDTKEPRMRRKIKLKKYVSPYQRYQLMKPYLDSLAKKTDDSTKKAEDNSEVQRLDNITKHFDKLTEMTPKPQKAETIDEDDEEDDKDISDVECEVVPLREGMKVKRKEKSSNNRPVDPEREKILAQIEADTEKRKRNIENKLVQEEINKRKQKRKSQADSASSQEEDISPSKVPKQKYEEFSYDSIDYARMFSTNKKTDAGSKDFRPASASRKLDKRDSSKQKQKAKNTGKSTTYKA